MGNTTFKTNITNYMISISNLNLFNPNECLWFLDRSYDDCMHQVVGNTVWKAIYLNGNPVLFKCTFAIDSIAINCINREIDLEEQNLLITYVEDWFDLETDLAEFYSSIGTTDVLYPLIKKYKGLRLIGINELFESLCWAILGQQINLPFAYKLKRAFVENYGERIVHNNNAYHLFPLPSQLKNCTVDDLRKLQISKSKADYILNLAHFFREDQISKEKLLSFRSEEDIRSKLITLKGIGPWTAEYVMMKCLKIKAALPIQDVGLHNALKHQLGLTNKPTIDEIKTIATAWSGWESYATLYLWRSLSVSPGETNT